jgi:ABC-type transporter Mla MlaB component
MGEPHIAFSNQRRDRWVVEGELTRANAAHFEQELNAIESETSTIELDLSALDITDGAALAILVDSLRRLSTRLSRLVLTGAPQMLGHNLYRIGVLKEDGIIQLVDMRCDEPYS